MHFLVQDMLWSEHKVIEDHIVPQPKECYGNSFSKFGRRGKNQRHEDDSNAISSAVETKNARLSYNVKYSSGININQELNYSTINMDTWPDLPNLSMTFVGGFNDGDSGVTGLVSDVVDACDTPSLGRFMGEYSRSSELFLVRDSSPLDKTSILLSDNEMQLNDETDLFGHDDKYNDNFMDYDWAKIEDFNDLDKMFRNNDSLFGNEMIDNAYTFLTASADLVSSTSRSIPVPDIPISGEQARKEVSYSYQLAEHSTEKLNPLQKIDSPNQILRTRKNEEAKVGSSQGLKNSLQISVPNTAQMLQSQSMEQPSSSHHLMLADHGYHAHQFHGLTSPPQFHSGKQQLEPTYLDFSKHRKAGAVNKPSTMTPQEKIEKLRRRQQMQAMLAIQKQREQYDHQISGSDVTEHSQKLPSSDASSVAEQDQSQMISSSLDGHLAEEAIYYQLQDAIRKLDMNVRLSIRDSLYRLARSAMERQNASDGSCTNKSDNEEDEISADEESIKDRYFRPPDSEAVTNPIDRIVAHLLFHNPSPMPIMDRDISMAISM
ncbi:hypothetical protein KSP39_PZI008994 [Platanthera zijinensis]|uniref:Protein LNK2 n=1 Tax=Platanthera zijinensis TaxID=2320716 RepID=A0AAP0BK76_9ASPA